MWNLEYRTIRKNEKVYSKIKILENFRHFSKVKKEGILLEGILQYFDKSLRQILKYEKSLRIKKN